MKEKPMENKINNTGKLNIEDRNLGYGKSEQELKVMLENRQEQLYNLENARLPPLRMREEHMRLIRSVEQIRAKLERLSE